MNRPSHPIIYLLFGLIAAASVLTGSVCTRAGNGPAKIRVIYTNDTTGYLEPCGCGGRYEGGLSRRASAIARLVKWNPNVVIVDSGNLSTTADKLGIISSIMSAMNYDAVGVGALDSMYREEFIRQVAANGLKVVDPIAPDGKSVLPYLIKSMSGIRVGVISFGAGCSTHGSSLQAFNFAYRTARKASDVLVLLDQGGIATRDWLEGDGAGMGAPDAVIGGASRGVLTQDHTIGKTHLLPTSQFGRHLGVADITVAADHSIKISAQMLLIDKNTAEDKAVAKRIEDFLLNPSRPNDLTAQSQGLGKGTYTSPETCKDCHKQIYDDWRATRHASSVKTLISANRMIADCLPCHSEEYRQTLKTTRQLSASVPTGVECATCHASVLPHGKNGPAESARRGVDPKLCASCHTPDRSPDYNEKSYLDKVSHNSAHLTSEPPGIRTTSP